MLLIWLTIRDKAEDNNNNNGEYKLWRNGYLENVNTWSVWKKKLFNTHSKKYLRCQGISKSEENLLQSSRSRECNYLGVVSVSWVMQLEFCHWIKFGGIVRYWVFDEVPNPFPIPSSHLLMKTKITIANAFCEWV